VPPCCVLSQQDLFSLCAVAIGYDSEPKVLFSCFFRSPRFSGKAFFCLDGPHLAVLSFTATLLGTSSPDWTSLTQSTNRPPPLSGFRDKYFAYSRQFGVPFRQLFLKGEPPFLPMFPLGPYLSLVVAWSVLLGLFSFAPPSYWTWANSFMWGFKGRFDPRPSFFIATCRSASGTILRPFCNASIERTDCLFCRWLNQRPVVLSQDSNWMLPYVCGTLPVFSPARQ